MTHTATGVPQKGIEDLRFSPSDIERSRVKGTIRSVSSSHKQLRSALDQLKQEKQHHLADANRSNLGQPLHIILWRVIEL